MYVVCINFDNNKMMQCFSLNLTEKQACKLRAFLKYAKVKLRKA